MEPQQTNKAGTVVARNDFGKQSTAQFSGFDLHLSQGAKTIVILLLHCRPGPSGRMHLEQQPDDQQPKFL
jgi:hypothetical protein